MISGKSDDQGNTEALFIHKDVLAAFSEIEPKSIDLVVSSPPYNIGKSYEKDTKLTFEQYVEWQKQVISELVKLVSDQGSICWQVGNFVRNGEVIPLDSIFYQVFADHGLKLRNRIIWKFNFGYNLDRRFSGRYETMLWFTLSDDYKFNLDPVRIPQIYPGKRHSKAKGERAGQPSGNPKGKNPSDFWEFSAERDFVENPIWDIPNVKASHPEKSDHPCQFPIELVERCVAALTEPGDKVLDPFVGTGATVIAALKHGRRGIGIDKDKGFLDIAEQRIRALRSGELPMRPPGQPVRRPVSTEKVAKTPDEWLIQSASTGSGSVDA